MVTGETFSWPGRTVQPWFASCRNGTGFAVTFATEMYLVTYSETDSVKFNDANVYNARKLHIHANLYDAFAEDKKQHCCGDKFVNGQFCKRLSSTISEQDFNENSGEVFTEIY